MELCSASLAMTKTYPDTQASIQKNRYDQRVVRDL